MKYVDADKLIKSVNNYQEGAKAALNPTDGDADYYKGKIDACKDIQEFITSLQQEQTESSNNLVDVDATYIAVAQTLGVEPEQYCHIISIPRCSIVDMMQIDPNPDLAVNPNRD